MARIMPSANAKVQKCFPESNSSEPSWLLMIRVFLFCFGIVMIVYANVQFFSLTREVT